MNKEALRKELEDCGKWFNETQFAGGKGDRVKGYFVKCDYASLANEYLTTRLAVIDDGDDNNSNQLLKEYFDLMGKAETEQHFDHLLQEHKWNERAKKVISRLDDVDGVKKICYCGSLRFIEKFKEVEYQSVIDGNIALLPCCMFVDIQREYGAGSDYKAKADELHKRKIDICDEVFVLNVGGYIGDSTRGEIEYAKSIGKQIKYLEQC